MHNGFVSFSCLGCILSTPAGSTAASNLVKRGVEWAPFPCISVSILTFVYLTEVSKQNNSREFLTTWMRNLPARPCLSSFARLERCIFADSRQVHGGAGGGTCRHWSDSHLCQSTLISDSQWWTDRNLCSWIQQDTNHPHKSPESLVKTMCFHSKLHFYSFGFMTFIPATDSEAKLYV